MNSQTFSQNDMKNVRCQTVIFISTHIMCLYSPQFSPLCSSVHPTIKVIMNLLMPVVENIGRRKHRPIELPILRTCDVQYYNFHSNTLLIR